MKHLLTFLACLALLIGQTACKSPVAYKSLKTVATAADAALMAYGDAYRAGKITPDQRTAIKAAHLKYQAAMQTAIAAAQLDLNAPAPAELVSFATSLIATINTITGKAAP